MNSNVPQIKFNKQLILTTEQLAKFYETTSDVIKKNFSNNKDKFAEGKHYYLLEGNQLKAFKNQVNNLHLVDKRTSHLYLWTKRGASRHAKMLGTERAWDVYDELEENYFNSTQQQLPIPKDYPSALRALADSMEENQKLKPDAAYTQKMLANPGLETTSIIAKNYGMSTAKFNQLLHELGIQYRQGKTWLLYAKYQDCGYTHVEPFAYFDQKVGTKKVANTMKWTQLGQKFLYDFLSSQHILPQVERLTLLKG